MFKRIIAFIVCICFLGSTLQVSFAQDPANGGVQLPVPGKMLAPAAKFMPLTLKGLVVHPENPTQFDFLMDTGNTKLSLGQDVLSQESLKLMKYFLTALTIPEEDLWVNLSPYEKERTIESNLGETLMGRDLLAEDYILKQLTASVIYPEDDLGKKFWSEVYKQAADKLGTTQIPVNTFNKVWIVPSEAVVWQHENKVMIVGSHLKVMLEEDYLAQTKGGVKNQTSSVASKTIRDLVLPVLERQVNEGADFAQLRQMYQAMILATWYKKTLKQNIISKVYANQKKMKGIDGVNSTEIEHIYQQYIMAFKKGAFNYIKEDIDLQGKATAKKYFSGGFTGLVLGGLLTILTMTNPPTALAQVIAKPVGENVQATWKASSVDQSDEDVIKTTEDSQIGKLSNDELFDRIKKAQSIQDRVNAIAELSHRETDPYIIKNLCDAAFDNGYQKTDVRQAAVIALGNFKTSEAAFSQIRISLKDRSPMVRVQAIKALAKSENKEKVRILGDLLKEKEGGELKAVVKALIKLDWKPDSVTDRFYFALAQQHWDKIIKMGDIVIPLAKEELYKTSSEKNPKKHFGLEYVLENLGVGFFGRSTPEWKFFYIATPIVVVGGLLGVLAAWKVISKRKNKSTASNSNLDYDPSDWSAFLKHPGVAQYLATQTIEAPVKKEILKDSEVIVNIPQAQLRLSAELLRVRLISYYSLVKLNIGEQVIKFESIPTLEQLEDLLRKNEGKKIDIQINDPNLAVQNITLQKNLTEMIQAFLSPVTAKKGNIWLNSKKMTMNFPYKINLDKLETVQNRVVALLEGASTKIQIKIMQRSQEEKAVLITASGITGSLKDLFSDVSANDIVIALNQAKDVPELASMTNQVFDIMNQMVDRAIVGNDKLGGIDFTTKNLDLQIKGNQYDVPWSMSEDVQLTSDIQGFEPQIIEIKAINLPVLLGIAK